MKNNEKPDILSRIRNMKFRKELTALLAFFVMISTSYVMIHPSEALNNNVARSFMFFNEEEASDETAVPDINALLDADKNSGETEDTEPAGEVTEEVLNEETASAVPPEEQSTSAPTSTPAEIVVPTLEPTSTPANTATAEAAGTPASTATASAESESTSDPFSTASAEPETTGTPETTASASPETTASAEPTGTPEATESPEPSPSATPEAEEEEELHFANWTEEDGEENKPEVIVTVDAPRGAFPEGTTMEVTIIKELDAKTQKQVEDKLEEENTEAFVNVTKIQAVDIVFRDAEGNEIEPAEGFNIKVSMRSTAIKEAAEETKTDTQLIHIKEDKETKETEAVTVEHKDATAEDTADDEIQFETDSFSMYVFVESETLETKYITADGETYKITVSYTKDAEIPNDSELVVREILRGTAEYDEYRAKTQEALGTSDVPVTEIADDEEVVVDEPEDTADSVTYQVVGNAQSQLTFFRLFDISIMDGEEEIEPKVPVEVVITYVEPMSTDGSNLDVVHFTDNGVEVIDEVTVSEDGTEITYQAESFSKYGTARSAVGEGDYIIYRDHSSSTDYALSYQNNGNLAMSGVTVSNGSVYSAQDNVVWTFTAVDGGYRISFVDNNGTTHYLRAQIPNNNNDGTLSTTTNVNDSTTVWAYGNNRLRATANNRTRELRQNNNAFAISRNNGETIYLAKIQEPATITIHYVNESGEEILEPHVLEDSTSIGVTAIRDIVQTRAGYTYHNTYLTSTSGTQIVPELRGAGGGTWEYQVYGQEAYTQFSGDTDIYVVYGDAYGSGSGGSGGGGGGDDLHIDTPTAGKVVKANTDGTFTLSLSITGEGAQGDSSKGANVILILDTSNSMNTSQTEGGTTKTRFEWARDAAQSVSSNLLGLNTEDNSDLVEMCLVEFNWDIATSGWYTVAGEANAGGIYPEGTFNRKIADAARNSGTNWEGALQAAITAANAHQDGDDTYIIFLTDGNPSAWTGTNNGQGRYTQGSESTTTTTSQYYYHISANYMHATDEARQIVQNGWDLYSIGMYGNVDVLEKLTNFAYTGRSDTSGSTGKYYPAAQTSALIQALNDIADVISNSLALAGVDFKDGIGQDVTHHSLSINVSGSLGGVTYTKSGGTSSSYSVTVDTNGNATFTVGSTSVPGTITTITYKKIVDVEGGDPTEQDATAQVYTATINGTTYYMPIATLSNADTDEGDFEWDLSPLGTLEKNATYTVSFKVWPDQDAYDYVTNLNNGIENYSWDYSKEVEVKNPTGTTAYYKNGVENYPNIVRYPTEPATFAAMSNTYQTVDYYIANTETSGDETSTTYEKGEPIALDIPDPMNLVSSSFSVRKSWSDSLDTSQLDTLIANAEAEGKVYGVTLNLLEDGEFYKSYTFTPVKNTETEKYEWPAQTINIAPALLTATYPGGGTYNTVTIDGDTYYVLNNGHQYILEETNTDSHFEFNTISYHPALVNGVLKNVEFDVDEHGNIVNGSTGTVVGTVPLVEFEGENTLRGGINIYKKVVEEDDTEVEDNTDVFDAQVTLTVPMKDGEPDFSHVENYYDTDDVTVLIPSVAWYRYYDKNNNVVYDDALIDAGILEDSGQPSAYGRTGQGENYDGSGWFYLDFNDTTGTVTGTVKITPQYTLRFTNMAAGTAYEVTETGTHGMQPSYEYWHDNAQSDSHIVIGNAGNNVRVTNKIVNRKVIVYKTDEGTTPLADAQFTINGETLTSGQDGYTAVIELPTSDTPYDLTETVAPNGYNKLTSAVKVTVSSSGVTYIQADYGGGSPQTAVKDENGNYVVHVRNNSGVVLPNTGGSGTLGYTLGGLTVMLTALMYGFRMRRRERRLY